MGSAAGPKTVLNGITSLLDAGSSKSWNVGISTNWTDRIGSNDATIINTVYNTDGPFASAGYVEFDGTSDYLDIASSTDFAFGTGDFTIEVWVYLKANNLGVIYSNEVANSLFLYLNSGNLVVRNYGTTNLFDLAGPSLNTWTHIALSRSGTDLRLFFNGVQQGSTVTNSTNWTQNGTEIGAYNNGTQSLNGYMSNLRVVKGTALYTAAFTPPTKSLTAVPNTVLLTCQGNTIADASSSGHTLTPNGDVTLTKEPFAGAGAVEFDGTGDYLTVPSDTDLEMGTGDFTIEMWVYSTDSSQDTQDRRFFATEDNAASSIQIGHINTTAGIVEYADQGSSNVRVTGTTDIRNQWAHIAVVRNSGTVTLYVNGVSEGTPATDSNSKTASTPTIGKYPGASGHFKGFMSNLRVIKGTALYTSNFTAPTRKLDPIENTTLLTCQGQNINDNSSSGHTITFNGNAKSSIVDGAFEFDGTANTRMTIPNTSDFDFAGGNFTLEWWGRYNVDTASGDAIITKGWDTVYAPFLIQLTSATQLTFYASGSGSAWNVSSGNAIHTGIEREVWYHYVLTRSGTSFKGYVNGVETMSFTSSTALMSNSDEITIGSGDDGHSTSELNGYISNLKVYKGKALTVAEITQNYTALKGRYGY
jgi:hypothetical protein